MDNFVCFTGNLVADPELRFTSQGTAVAAMRIAVEERRFSKETNQYETADTLFITINVWRQMAENCAETLSTGQRVSVTGKLKQRSYETREGDKRTVFEVEASEVSPSLRWAAFRASESNTGANSAPSNNRNAGGVNAPSNGGGFGSNVPSSDPFAAPSGFQDVDVPPF